MQKVHHYEIIQGTCYFHIFHQFGLYLSLHLFIWLLLDGDQFYCHFFSLLQMEVHKLKIHLSLCFHGKFYFL